MQRNRCDVYVWLITQCDYIVFTHSETLIHDAPDKLFPRFKIDFSFYFTVLYMHLQQRI